MKRRVRKSSTFIIPSPDVFRQSAEVPSYIGLCEGQASLASRREENKFQDSGAGLVYRSVPHPPNCRELKSHVNRVETIVALWCSWRHAGAAFPYIDSSPSSHLLMSPTFLLEQSSTVYRLHASSGKHFQALLQRYSEQLHTYCCHESSAFEKIF